MYLVYGVLLSQLQRADPCPQQALFVPRHALMERLFLRAENSNPTQQWCMAWVELPSPEGFVLQEALWSFHMPERSLQISLLLVLHVVEPSLFFDTPKVDFGQLLVGLSAQRTVKLVNPENQPFQFELDRKSLADLGGQAFTGFVLLNSFPPKYVGLLPRLEGTSFS